MFPIDRRFPLLAAVLAGVAMITTTAWQGYLFWQESTLPARATAAAAAVPEQNSRPVPQPDWQQVPLFGRQTDDAANTVVSTENLPETNLRLYLRGVLAADGDFPGSALVEDDKGKTEMYLVGDELPGSARLHAVFPSRVVLERSGKLENLYFPDTDTQSSIVLPASAAQQPLVTPQPPASAAPQPAPDVGREQTRREEIRRRLEQLRERLRNQN